jgi:hypothetical protein
MSIVYTIRRDRAADFALDFGEVAFDRAAGRQVSGRRSPPFRVVAFDKVSDGIGRAEFGAQAFVACGGSFVES